MRNFSGLLGLGIAHPLTRWGGATNKEVHHPLVPLDGSKREYTTPMSCSSRLSMIPATTPATFHPPSVLSSALATKLTTPVKCGAASTFNFLMVSVTALRMSPTPTPLTVFFYMRWFMRRNLFLRALRSRTQFKKHIFLITKTNAAQGQRRRAAPPSSAPEKVRRRAWQCTRPSMANACFGVRRLLAGFNHLVAAAAAASKAAAGEEGAPPRLWPPPHHWGGTGPMLRNTSAVAGVPRARPPRRWLAAVRRTERRPPPRVWRPARRGAQLFTSDTPRGGPN